MRSILLIAAVVLCSGAGVQARSGSANGSSRQEPRLVPCQVGGGGVERRPPPRSDDAKPGNGVHEVSVTCWSNDPNERFQTEVSSDTPVYQVDVVIPNESPLTVKTLNLLAKPRREKAPKVGALVQNGGLVAPSDLGEKYSSIYGSDQLQVMVLWIPATSFSGPRREISAEDEAL